MQNRMTGTVVALSLLSGCASIEKPPERQYWDEVPASTQCTDDKSVLAPQMTGSILASGLGGADIGVGLAAGYFPVIGIGLATVGLTSAADVDKKIKEIEKCQEFKAYVAGRGSASNSASEGENSIEERLEQLESLRDSGSISDEEYKESREKIIEDL